VSRSSPSDAGKSTPEGEREMSNTVSLLDRDIADVRWLLSSAWSGRYLIALVSICLGLIMFLVAITGPVVYRASTTVVPAFSDRSSLGGIASALGGLGGLASMAGIGVNIDSGNTEEALAVLVSRPFLESFLDERPEFAAGANEHSLWSLSGLSIGRSDPDTPATLVRKFRSDVLKISRDRKTGLITISVDWRDGKEAAAWANDLVLRLNTEMRLRTRKSADESLRFLRQELARETLLETREALSRLIEAQLNRRMMAAVSADYAFRVVEQATEPDSSDRLRPRPIRYLAAGLALGGLLGTLIVLFRARKA
jgi:uncharacterized protein involved in exopolysaccharide biosynthesis